MSDSTPPTEQPLSKEETALLIRSLWEALLEPPWLRNDLIDFGKLVFAKVPLKEIDPAVFAKLLPHLTTIARSLGKKILQHAAPALPASPAPPPERSDGDGK
jgi:hypothetical protein